MTFSDFIFYAEANLICSIIFLILVVHDYLSVDRQEKQIKYDHALIGFIFYFLADAVWAAIEADFIPKNRFSTLLINLTIFVILAIVTYLWLEYVMAAEKARNRESKKKKFLLLLPFIVSILVLVVTYLVAPGLLINDELELQLVYNIMLILVPDFYIIAVIFYSLKKAKGEANPIEKRKHLFIGIFPVSVTIGGLIQTLFLPNVPIYCFVCTILMLLFYINSMEDRISVDPLTNLNNRGQLHRFFSQEGGTINNKRTFVVMMDINDFKAINDNDGRIEGDRALVIVADVLKIVAKSHSAPVFIGRYGGDEFIMIVQPTDEGEIDSLTEEIRSSVRQICVDNETGYVVSLGVGYDEYLGKDDSLQKCMERADVKLYDDKKRMKEKAKTEKKNDGNK